MFDPQLSCVSLDRACGIDPSPYIVLISKPLREEYMTPDERQMISGLFDRMRQQGPVEKDRDAEALIRDALRQNSDAPYMLVQTALVQEMVMQQSQERIQELEDEVRHLQSQAARPQQSSGSFLGGLFGGGSRPAAPASVPSAGRQSAGFAAAPRAGSPGGRAPGAGAPMQQGGQQGGQYGGQPMQQGMPMQQQQPAGGGFMRSAMTTAAGVAGGMLAANAISNMMKGDSAHASPAPKSAQAEGNDPAGSYDSGQDQGGGNDPAGSYEAPQEDAGGYDDGGSWSDE